MKDYKNMKRKQSYKNPKKTLKINFPKPLQNQSKQNKQHKVKTFRKKVIFYDKCSQSNDFSVYKKHKQTINAMTRKQKKDILAKHNIVAKNSQAPDAIYAVILTNLK